jgi:hypothetical protein
MTAADCGPITPPRDSSSNPVPESIVQLRGRLGLLLVAVVVVKSGLFL